MLFVADLQVISKRLNPAWERTLGFTADELCRRPFPDFVHPDDHEVTIAEMKQLSEGANTISFENRYRCKDRNYKWLLWNAHSLLAQQAIYADARDIAERKLAVETSSTDKLNLQRAIPPTPRQFSAPVLDSCISSNSPQARFFPF